MGYSECPDAKVFPFSTMDFLRCSTGQKEKSTFYALYL